MPTKAGVHCHDANQIDHVQKILDRRSWCCRVQGDARFGTVCADRLHGAVNVRRCLNVGGDDVGTGLRERFDVGVNGGDHQMHVHHAFDVGADRGAGGGTERDVWHEMPVHDIDVNPVSALGFDGFAFGTKVGEVSG